MIVTCNAERWEYVGLILRKSLGEDAQPCGRTFDDVERSTICPHDPIGGSPVCRETDLFKTMCPHCKRVKENTNV